jgi:hypothetical protein
MNRLKYNLAITIVTLGLAGPSLAATTVYVPVGSANEILVIDGEQDRVIGSISDVSNVHGLAASAKSGLLVAGSMSLAPKNQAIPEGMSEDEHNAHHADSQLLKAQAAGSLSNITIIAFPTTARLHRMEGMHWRLTLPPVTSVSSICITGAC